jgi:hypothetical protein
MKPSKLARLRTIAAAQSYEIMAGMLVRLADRFGATALAASAERLRVLAVRLQVDDDAEAIAAEAHAIAAGVQDAKRKDLQ